MILPVRFSVFAPSRTRVYKFEDLERVVALADGNYSDMSG